MKRLPAIVGIGVSVAVISLAVVYATTKSIGRAVDLDTKRSDSFPLRARKAVRGGAKLVLAIETVSGPDGGWQLDLSDAFQAAMAVADNRPAPAVNVAQDQNARRGDYGSNYCARAFAVAAFLGKFSELGGMPSFSCNQQERTYSFAYASSAK